MTLVEAFLDVAARAPQRPAIVEAGGHTITFAELASTSAILADRFLRQGIVKGDKVLVGVPPSIALYAGLAALWRIGAIAVFPEPATGLKGFRFAASSQAPKALLAPWYIRLFSRVLPETRDIRLNLSPRFGQGMMRDGVFEVLSDDDVALISFTSGTTGLPKAIARSHGMLLAQHRALEAILNRGMPDEVDLVAFPAFVLTCLGNGTTAVLPAWNPRRHDLARADVILHQIGIHGVTRLLVPPVVAETLAAQRVPSHVRRIFTGGGPIYPDVIRKFLQHSPHCGFTVVYGSTEAEPISYVDAETLTEDDWLEAVSGGGLLVGRPVKEASIQLCDGEIIVSGPHVNRGYIDASRNAENKIEKDGVTWHRTGDMGRLDAKDRLWLMGRALGQPGRIHPFAVETAARCWPGVSAAVCVPRGQSSTVLFIAGDSHMLPRWQDEGRKFGDIQIVPLSAIPMDQRHRSKPDYGKLRQIERSLT